MSTLMDLDRAQMLEGLVRRQVGKGIGVGAQDLSRPAPGLLPAERVIVAQANQERRREFAAGRAAARAALSQLGIYGQPVLADDDGSPVWPANAVGSIAHTKAVSLAAVGTCDRIQSVGLDIAPAEPLSSDAAKAFLTPAERAWLIDQPQARSGLLARTLETVKTCTFKAQYPLTGAARGLEEFEVAMRPRQKCFEVTTPGTDRVSGLGSALTGHYASLMGFIVVTIVLRRW